MSAISPALSWKLYQVATPFARDLMDPLERCRSLASREDETLVHPVWPFRVPISSAKAEFGSVYILTW